MTLLSRVHLSVEAESDSKHFQLLTYHYSEKLWLSTEVEFVSEPKVYSPPKNQSLETKIKFFGWV